MAEQLKAAPALTEEVDPESTGDGCGQDRPMRADARRNNEKIVTAAKKVFASVGGHASIEAIAKEAGVGVGTLYRHFPNRIDVVEAVYRNDVEVLVQAAESAVDELEPWPALVSWLNAFVVYSQGKRTFLTELHEAFEKSPNLKLNSRERIDYAMELVFERAQRAGVVRRDVNGSDLMQLIYSMCSNALLADAAGERMLEVVIDGLRSKR